MELHSIPERFFLNLKGLFGACVVSSTKNEYGSAVHFLLILTKSLVLMYDGCTIWLISLLLGIFTIKKLLAFSLTSFGTWKSYWIINTREIFNFLPLTNNSVTIRFNF